jgi:hypothetical protein
VYCGSQSHDGERFPPTDDARTRLLRDALDGRESPARAIASAVDEFDFEDDPAVVIAVEGPEPLIGNNPRLPMERIAADKATAGAGVNSANG